MKNCTGFNAYTLIILFFIIASCEQNKPLVLPKNQSNPWIDDYSALSRMENYSQWGPYNVHDPSFKKLGEYYYMYSTDAIYRENRKEAKDKGIYIGYIQIRRSKDLVNWEFRGWAFPEIPDEAVKWVHENSQGRGATNIWAPYIIKHNDKYRLYYCVSAFGKKSSYIGLAESASPEGPWTQKGCVVKSNNQTLMNAIDPTVYYDEKKGKQWMTYGSFFGGLYCVELDPLTGLTMDTNNLGHLVARRANYKKDNLEAPEVIYNPSLKKYFIFLSYDPLMTTYNIRVGRSDNAEGPFYDYFGKNIADTTNNFPIIVTPYKFNNHPGWAGTGHCGVLKNPDGRYFMAHQGRLSPQNQLMVLHIREIFFTPDGWPVVSPERFVGNKKNKITKKDVEGVWEIIRITEPKHERELEAGQVLWGEGELEKDEWNYSSFLQLTTDQRVNETGRWNFSKRDQTLSITLQNETINNLITFAGHDWENETETLLFTGLDNNGRTVWGKKIK